MVIADQANQAQSQRPEDSLAQIAPALRELAAGVKQVPQELKGEIQAVEHTANLAYGRGLADGCLIGVVGVLVLFCMALIARGQGSGVGSQK